MKVKITSICLGLMMIMTSFSAKADIFYVTSGEAFTLKPAVTDLISYLWLVDGATATAGPLGVLTQTFTTTNSVAKHLISLSVVSGASTCVSNVVEHTVYVLPTIIVTANAVVTNFCVGATTLSAEITTSLSQTVTDFGDSGISLSAFKWYKDNTLISTATASSYTATATGTYKVLLEYIIPGTTPSTKLTNVITPGTKDILQTLPVPLTPAISLF